MQIDQAYATQPTELQNVCPEALAYDQSEAYARSSQADVAQPEYQDVTSSLKMNLLKRIMDPNYTAVPVALTKPMDYARLQPMGWNSYSSFLVDRIGCAVVAKRCGFATTSDA